MTRILLAALMCLCGWAGGLAQTQQETESQTRDYYRRWVGVRAAEFAVNLRNRCEDHPTVRLGNYQGKRLMLLSFDAGDFVNGPHDEDRTMGILSTLKTMRSQYGSNVAVVGFTSGPGLFRPEDKIADKLSSLTDFPLVNNALLARDPLQEPYNLLQRWPSLIVVDTNGLIAGIYPPPLSLSNVLSAFAVTVPVQAEHSPPGPPPVAVTNWSSRNFWVLFTYNVDLQPGDTFRKGCGTLRRVYLASEVPTNEVSGLNPFLGKRMKRLVRAGEAIRQSDFVE